VWKDSTYITETLLFSLVVVYLSAINHWHGHDRLTLVITGTKTLGFVVVASGTEVESGITLITTFTLVELVITPKTGVTRTIIVPSTIAFSAVILLTVGSSFKSRVGVDRLEFISSHQTMSRIEWSDRGKSQDGRDGREGTEEGGEDSHRENRLWRSFVFIGIGGEENACDFNLSEYVDV
jgi:hypothetical protein